MSRQLNWLSRIQKLSNGALSKSCVVVSQEWLWLQTKTEYYRLPRGESLSGQQERDDGKGDYELTIWKHFSIEGLHIQVLYWSYFLSCISQAILRLCFCITRLRFIWQIFLLPKARNGADFHSLCCQKSRILKDTFLASWWFNLAFTWLAFELSNTCNITSSLQNDNADQSWTISVGTCSLCRLQLSFEVGTRCQLSCFMGIACLWADMS